jgi:hypothetical protein
MEDKQDYVITEGKGHLERMEDEISELRIAVRVLLELLPEEARTKAISRIHAVRMIWNEFDNNLTEYPNACELT